MSHIEVFADIVCPFTHVGLRRLRETSRARGSQLSLRVRAWPLELVNGAPLGPDLLAQEIAALRSQVAPDLFTGFDASLFPLSSIPALGMTSAAYALDETVGAMISLALRDALFEEGRDISDPGVLAEIGQRFGVAPLDPAAAEAAVRSDWRLGQERGVDGSPHFFVGDRGWFCPSLEIRHDHDGFDIQLSGEGMREFYAAAFA
jgi:predicted DsbA family dithiol-disulfide isomerase